MSSKMFNDSLEEDNFSSNRTNTADKNQDNNGLTPRSDNILESKESSDYDAEGGLELVPFYGGSVPLSCVRHIQQISKHERNKRMKKPVSFLPVLGNTDTTGPAVRKEMEARNLVGRWLHQPTTVDTKNKTGIQRVNKFTLSSSMDVDEIENRMRNLNFELNKSKGEHSVKCLNSTHSETRTCDNSSVCRSWLASHSSSSLDAQTQYYQRMKLHKRVANSFARRKTTSYLEQFYQKRYGLYPIQDIPREGSLCPTVGDDLSAQSVSSLSSANRSVVSTNSEVEEEFYRKLLEKEREKQRYGKELQAVNRGENCRIQSKSEQTLSANKPSVCPSGGMRNVEDCKSVLEAMKPELIQSIKKKHLVEANGALKYATYKPYNIKDYRNLPPPKLGSLGPDLESSKDKLERMKKQRAYGENASIRNRQRYMEKEQLRTTRMLLPGIRVPPLALNGTPPFQPRLDTVPSMPEVNAPFVRQASSNKPKAEVRPRKKLNPSTCKLGTESSEVAPRACLLTTLQERHQKEVEIANTIRREIV